MASVPDHAAIYKKLHDNREAHIEQARRARDYQAELAEASKLEEVWMEVDGMKVYRLKERK